MYVNLKSKGVRVTVVNVGKEISVTYSKSVAIVVL